MSSYSLGSVTVSRVGFGAMQLSGPGVFGPPRDRDAALRVLQNQLNVADRGSMPVLEECYARGIAFVPFFPLGSAFGRNNAVLGSRQVVQAAQRLGHTPAQVALAWMLSLRPNVLLIPGTSSVRHLEENLAASGIELDEQAQDELGAASSGPTEAASVVTNDHG
jgi:aryl-alcohol dehydrogenase-like predicted oxidoreductase